MLRDYFENICFQAANLIKDIIMKSSMLRYRSMAHKDRRIVVRKKGTSVVNKQVKRSIKEYALQRFGSKAYWPSLALYTEMRGQFIKGWLPIDYERYIWEPKINPPVYSNISEMKTFDFMLFGEFALKPLFLFISGNFYSAELEVMKVSQVKSFLYEYNDLIVVKEELTMGGKSVRIIHSSDFKPEELKEPRNYVIQPYVKQFKMLNELYPESVNTLRITTHLKANGSVGIKFVVLRFGINGSKVDNLDFGGHYIYFNSEGKPSNTAYDKLGIEVGERHINTGYLFSNIRIPKFHKILDLCKTAHKKFPYVHLIGWDICINDLGEPKLLEWNAFRPGINIVDANFGPFWAEDDVL